MPQRLHNHATAPAPFDPARYAPQYPPDLELEPLHLDINLALDIAGRSADGEVTTTVVAHHAGAQTLTLHAVDLAIAEVLDADERDISWRADGQTLTVRWQEPFAKDEQRKLVVRYTANQPTTGIYFSQPSAAYPDAPWSAITDHETERARHWLPCVDLPNVRTTLDFHLRSDERFTFVANGYAVGETLHDDGSKTAHWRLDERCPSYLICFGVGDFVRADDGAFDDGEKTIPFAYFCSPQHTADDLRRSFGRTGAMMAWMTKRLGRPFPYPKYFQIASPVLSGAMENISLVSWDERFVMNAEMAKEYTALVDSVNLHEMSHSYFGDAVVCRDFAHAWLKESWATYIEQVWHDETKSADEGLYVYYEHANAYFDEADNRYRRPIVTRHFRSSWDMYDRHLYPGGACRLHTLRCELGDVVFWAAVTDYLTRYDGKVVETDDFRHIMEQHSGRALGQFFDQWFFTPGYPDLAVTFHYDAAKQQGVFEIEQKQINKEEGIPAFVLPTDVGWTIDGVDYMQPIRLDQARQVFTIAMAQMPEQVRFDPGCKVLHRLSFNPGDDLLHTQLTRARDILGRIHAVKELAETGRRANIEAITSAYRAEPFWGVRCEMAHALGSANSEAAIEGLVALLDWEQQPLVIPELLRAMRAYRDARIRTAVTAQLEAGLSYEATQLAYEALGAQRTEAPFDLLAAAAQQAGFNGIAQSGALRGLAATRRPEALALLLQSVDYGATSSYVRPAAVGALAEYGRTLDKVERERVVERLIDLLRDPVYQVAVAAVRGLGAMQASEAIPALERFARARVVQEAAVAERVIDSLRRADQPGQSALEKQVETLNDRLRKLEDQLQRIS